MIDVQGVPFVSKNISPSPVHSLLLFFLLKLRILLGLHACKLGKDNRSDADSCTDCIGGKRNALVLVISIG